MTHTRDGRLARTRFGYGFVRIEDEREDLFIPPMAVGEAMHGDLVRAGFLESRPEGDAHEILEVLERSQAGIVGRIEARGRDTILRPERPEYPPEIRLRLHGRRQAPEGGRVVVRLRARPAVPLEGQVVAVFGDDDPSEDSLLVALEEGVPVEFDPEALDEAGAFGPESVGRAVAGRADFRGEPVLTIDPANAKDHDDALSVHRSQGGRHWIGIHIADVTHYVRPDGALDREARERGTSSYLADATYPMLPEPLSAGWCSLSEGEPRLTVSVLAELDEEGSLHGSRITEGVIRSEASLSYEEAARLLQAGSGPAAESLGLLDRIARALRKRRLEHGGLDIDLPEVRPVLDARGEPVAFAETPRLPTHSLVEEFMLLANRIVGTRAAAREVPFLYRIHERPRYDKLRAFFEAARYLGRSAPADIVTDAKQLRRWVGAGGTPRDRLLNLFLLRALEKARYDLVDVGHFGLGMRGYAHFTSPIRRYPDLANHRIVKRFLLEGSHASVADAWTFAGSWLNARVAADTSAAEIRADDAERGVSRLKAVRFAMLRLGEETRGTIIGVVPGGLFVSLDAWKIEGFLPKRALGDPSLTLAEHGFSFRSKRSRHRYGLGDNVAVMIGRADLERREVELVLAPRMMKGRRRAGRGATLKKGARQRGRRR
jgi:ribonuclease R